MCVKCDALKGFCSLVHEGRKGRREGKGEGRNGKRREGRGREGRGGAGQGLGNRAAHIDVVDLQRLNHRVAAAGVWVDGALVCSGVWRCVAVWWCGGAVV